MTPPDEYGSAKSSGSVSESSGSSSSSSSSSGDGGGVGILSWCYAVDTAGDGFLTLTNVGGSAVSVTSIDTANIVVDAVFPVSISPGASVGIPLSGAGALGDPNCTLRVYYQPPANALMITIFLGNQVDEGWEGETRCQTCDVNWQLQDAGEALPLPWSGGMWWLHFSIVNLGSCTLHIWSVLVESEEVLIDGISPYFLTLQPGGEPHYFGEYLMYSPSATVQIYTDQGVQSYEIPPDGTYNIP